MSREITNKFRKRKRALFVRRIFLSGVILAIIAGGSLYLADKFSRVEKIEVKGNQRIHSEEIKEYAKSVLNKGVYRSLLKKEGDFWISKKDLEKNLKENFSAIGNVTVSRNLLEKSAVIKIEERSPEAIWCALSKCFYMDGEGVIFRQAPEFSGELILKINDKRIDVFEKGNTVINPEMFEDLKKFFFSVEKNNWHDITRIEIKEGPEFFLYSDGPTLTVDAETDFERALENLILFLNSTEGKNFEKIDYIDLRFKNKIFYKI